LYDINVKYIATFYTAMVLAVFRELRWFVWCAYIAAIIFWRLAAAAAAVVVVWADLHLNFVLVELDFFW